MTDELGSYLKLRRRGRMSNDIAGAIQHDMDKAKADERLGEKAIRLRRNRLAGEDSHPRSQSLLVLTD